MIHVLDYINPELRHVDHWRTMVPDMLTRHGYDVNVMLGDTIIPRMSGLLGETYYKMSQFSNVYEDVLSKKVSPNDVFIVADAWNFTSLAIRYISDTRGLKLKMIGYWRDGIYDIDSKIWRSTLRRPRHWSRAYERSLFHTYDYNCFLSDVSASKFKSRYNLKRTPTIVTTGFPYGEIRRIRETYPVVEKENIIVLPHDSVNDDQRDIFKALQRYLSDYEFVDCVELRLSRDEYYELLNRAKIVMAINLSETDPTNVYEGMVFGCVPVIPSRLVYTMFPDRYYYDSRYTQPPMLNFVRGREHIHGVIRNVIDNYDVFAQLVDTDVRTIESMYFNDEPLLTILKEII